MALQSSFYNTDGTTRTYPSTKHIATKQHVSVYGKRVSDSTWVILAVDLYELVNNSIVFDTAPDIVIYSQIEVRVADTAVELEDSPSDIAIVAGAIADVINLSNNINVVENVNNNMGAVTTVSANITNLNSIVSDVIPNLPEILLADDNATIATTKAIEASMSATLAQGYAESIIPSLLVKNIDTIADLATIDPTIVDTNNVFVKDLDRGGLFVWSSTGTANGGTVFAGLTGYWIRQYSGAVNVKWFGAKGDGVTDDYNSFLAALSVSKNVYMPNDSQYFIGSTLAIPAQAELWSDNLAIGSSLNNTSCPYATTGGAIKLSSTATIRLGGSASVNGLLIYRNGMVFPSTDASLFSGTAITIFGDDARILNCTILGFNKAIYSSGYQRPRVSDCNIDCVNGIEITQCADIAYVNKVHCWPFSTIANGVLSTSIRAGRAFHFHDLCDWGKITDCFSWGYYRGFQVTNANSCVLSGCGADNWYNGTPQHTSSIGFVINGTSQDTKLIGCQSAAQDTAGVLIETSASLTTRVLEHSVWGGSDHGLLINSGDCYILGGRIKNTTYGISETNASSIINIDSVSFDGITTNIINPSTATTNIFLGKNDYFDYAGVVGTTAMTSPVIASAAAVTLPNNGDLFNITGTTNFGTLTNGRNGRTVTLMFSGILAVLNSTGSYNAMRLSGGANFTTSNGATLTLRHNGVQWYEIGRSV